MQKGVDRRKRAQFRMNLLFIHGVASSIELDAPGPEEASNLLSPSTNPSPDAFKGELTADFEST